MGKRKHTGPCIDCHERPAKYAVDVKYGAAVSFRLTDEGLVVPEDGVEIFATREARDRFVADFPDGRKALESTVGCCERCWRRRRYHNPSDNYREMVNARKVAWRERRKQQAQADST
jgi:hypothetical protein